MSDLKTDKCKKCGTDMTSDEKVCPSCGAEVPQGFNARPWIFLAIIILVLMEIMMGRGTGSENNVEPTTEIVK